MQIDWETAARFGGEAAIQARVTAFQAALQAHRSTVGEPKPVEHALIERIVAEGGQFTVEPAPTPDEPPPPPAVPPMVTARQARLALLGAGLLSAVEAWIAAQGQAVQITWEYSMFYERNSPLIDAAASGLGLTSQQIDSLFIAAAAL